MKANMHFMLAVCESNNIPNTLNPDRYRYHCRHISGQNITAGYKDRGILHFMSLLCHDIAGKARHTPSLSSSGHVTPGSVFLAGDF